MSEISKYEEQIKKMQGLCDEHDLVYRFKKDSYPITFTIGNTLRAKIESILVKMINYWQQFFFRDLMEKGVLRKSDMPQIDSEITPEDAEPLPYDEPDDGVDADEGEPA